MKANRTAPRSERLLRAARRAEQGFRQAEQLLNDQLAARAARSEIDQVSRRYHHRLARVSTLVTILSIETHLPVPGDLKYGLERIAMSTLTIHHAGAEITFDAVKVDRTALYGKTVTVTKDGEGSELSLATLTQSGAVIRSGGSKGIYLTADGLWIDKPIDVDLDGNALTRIESSYSAPVTELQKVSIDHYLSHNMTGVYQLTPSSIDAQLVRELKAGTIYEFPYSYGRSFEPDAGFLLQAADGNLFLVYGKPADIEFIGLPDAADLDEEQDEDEDDEPDFGSM